MSRQRDMACTSKLTSHASFCVRHIRGILKHTNNDIAGPIARQDRTSRPERGAITTREEPFHLSSSERNCVLLLDPHTPFLAQVR